MLTSNEKQVLTDLVTIISQLDLPMILVGAGARLLMFDQKFAVQGRRTKDWDVAVSINNWEAYKQLSEYLTTGDYPHIELTILLN